MTVWRCGRCGRILPRAGRYDLWCDHCQDDVIGIRDDQEKPR